MFSYTLKRNTRSRSIRISINATGDIVVSAPKYVSIRDIEGFIEKSSDWIIKVKAKTANKAKTETSETVLIFGKLYKKQETHDFSKNSGILLINNTIIYNSLDSSEQAVTWSAKAQKQLDRFMKQIAENYIFPRTHTLAKKMNIQFNAVSFKQQKTRWGSCSSKGNLNFNWRLAHFEPKVIDYVIIHELAHRKHMDHSHRFWHFVEQFDPEYKQHTRLLKKYSVGLE